jgi:hypothetical protein
MDRQYNSQQKAVIDGQTIKQPTENQFRFSVGCCFVWPSITAFCWLLYCLSINYGFLLAVVLFVHQLRLSVGCCIVCPSITAFCWLLYCLSINSSCLNALSITVLEDLIKPTLDYCDVTLSQKFEARLAKALGKYVKK